MMVSSALPDLTMTSVKVFWRGVELGLGEQLGHAEHAVHRRADLVAHIGEEFGFGAVGGFGLEQQLRCIPRRRGGSPSPSAGIPRWRRWPSTASRRPLAQSSSLSLQASASRRSASMRDAGAHQHRLREQVVLVADFAVAPFVDLLRAGEHAEIAHDVARRPEQVAIDRCRIDLVGRRLAENFGLTAASAAVSASISACRRSAWPRAAAPSSSLVVADQMRVVCSAKLAAFFRSRISVSTSEPSRSRSWR